MPTKNTLDKLTPEYKRLKGSRHQEQEELGENEDI